MDVEASLTKDNVYKYPIYGVPRDLKRADLGKFHPRWKGEILIYRLEKDSIAPYYTREEIEKNGAINKKSKGPCLGKKIQLIYFFYKFRDQGD